ncbi:MAG: TetR family transcriptional regulator [Deltaproteobacteria bacterium]|nr:TetR family transcriptional regulator [Nannocystaceae bacterium]
MGTLRARNRLAAMVRVQDAAVMLCTRHGFEAVTVEDIARAAEVSPASAYRYFGTKEAMVLWDGPSEETAEALQAAVAEGPPIVALRDFVRQRARDDASELARQRLIYATPALVAASWAILVEHQGVIAKALGRGIEAEVLASASLGAIEVAYDHWQRSGTVGGLDRLLVRAFAPLTKLR